MLQQQSVKEFKGQVDNKKPMSMLGGGKDERGWPSFGQLFVDLSKFSLETLVSAFSQFTPSRFRSDGPHKGLAPLKDHLRMPKDEVEPPLVDRQSAAAPVIENRQIHTPITAEKYSESKPHKVKSSSFKDPSLSSKHRSSKRQEYAEFYGSGEMPPYIKSKGQKERSRHRQREKSGEVVYGTEAKPVEMKAVDYENPKFDHYNMRTKYIPGESFRFNPQ